MSMSSLIGRQDWSRFIRQMKGIWPEARRGGAWRMWLVKNEERVVGVRGGERVGRGPIVEKFERDE
jgi:hypothetical protein